MTRRIAYALAATLLASSAQAGGYFTGSISGDWCIIAPTRIGENADPTRMSGESPGKSIYSRVASIADCRP
jgi:hypothetical protein